jgi:hypothetical protein
VFFAVLEMKRRRIAKRPVVAFELRGVVTPAQKRNLVAPLIRFRLQIAALRVINSLLAAVLRPQNDGRKREGQKPGDETRCAQNANNFPFHFNSPEFAWKKMKRFLIGISLVKELPNKNRLGFELITSKSSWTFPKTSGGSYPHSGDRRRRSAA